MITIYTDGSCLKNPGKGGAGYVAVLDDGTVKQTWSQGFALTTNNRMEIYACIRAIADNRKEPIAIVTDSQYVKKGITEWIQSWKKKQWQTSAKTDVKNKDLWERLDDLNTTSQVEWKWTRGHDGNEHNETADRLARIAAQHGPYDDTDEIK